MNDPKAPDVPSHLALAIVATMICSPPGGIVALVYAARVREFLEAGDFEAARRASRKARAWGWGSIVVGVIGGIVLIGGGVALVLYYLVA